jgi:hypothetical protein
MACKCGFTKDLSNNCDGSHKIVKAVREQIVKDIEAIEIVPSITNALGMQTMAIKAAKG